MKRFPRQVILICLVSVGMLPLDTYGDAIMVSKAMTASTVAEIFVEDDGIRVEMEIGVADLDAFANLLPDAVLKDLGKEPRPLAERIETFFQRDWVIRCDDGEPLPGRLMKMVPRKRIRRDEITGEPLPVQPADAENVLFVELAYTWSSRPDSLTILPPMSEDRRMSAANIGFVLYHGGVPVNDFRYLAAESTVDLDWDDPWYSRFRHRNLKRQYRRTALRVSLRRVLRDSQRDCCAAQGPSAMGRPWPGGEAGDFGRVARGPEAAGCRDSFRSEARLPWTVSRCRARSTGFTSSAEAFGQPAWSTRRRIST